MESIALSSSDLRETLGALGLQQRQIANLLGVGARNLRRWRSGDRRIPYGIALLLRLIAAGAITVAQLEQAAAVLAKGGDDGGAVCLDSDATTAEKVFALTATTCRWPLGDPDRPDFRFCREPVAAGKVYCETHCSRAFWIPIHRRIREPRDDAVAVAAPGTVCHSLRGGQRRDSVSRLASAGLLGAGFVPATGPPIPA
jgi:transcriptional regulator with XRE-family HTH domain